MRPADRKPAPKIESTQVPPPPLARSSEEKDERAIDEAVDASFPASDPPAIASPGSTAAVKNVAESGRDVPAAEPDPAKKGNRPAVREKQDPRRGG